MAKNRTHKQVRHYKGELKRLQAEIKRLKKEPRDKDEVEYDEQGNDVNIEVIPCVHCTVGFMSKINIVDKQYWKCGSCLKTKKA